MISSAFISFSQLIKLIYKFSMNYELYLISMDNMSIITTKDRQTKYATKKKLFTTKYENKT